MMFLSRLSLALFVLVLLPGAATAQSRYLLETSGVSARDVAGRYGLPVIQTWTAQAHEYAVVEALAPLTTAQLGSVEAEPGVVEFEPDQRLRSAEAEPASRAAILLEPLAASLAQPGTQVYFGATVRAAYVQQPGTAMVALAEALRTFGTGNTTVAVIDTGVDPQHPALRQVLLPGYDFTRHQPGASELRDLDSSTVAILDSSTVAILDGKQFPKMLNSSTVALLDSSTVAILDGQKLPSAFGHGTMVAGLVHLVAPTARILPLKAFRGDGTASLADIVEAVYHAVNAGARVISMSFSLAAPSPQLETALAFAASRGVLCVSSAGNDGKEKRVYPAAYRGVVGVGSTNFSDRRSPFSNYGGTVFTSAPGEALITTYPGNNYAAVWGTSFSTALVAGGLALIDQVKPGIRLDQVRDLLNKGKKIGQDMGDARLLLPASLTACQLAGR